MSNILNTVQSVIAGIDEAGRGPLAGPVVAGACVIPCSVFKRRGSENRWSPFERKRADDILIGDSKQLSENERERAYDWITQHCHWGMGMVSAADIDAHGILASTERAMHLALEQLQKTVAPTHLLVDGRDAFWFDVPHSSVIRGDSLEPCIAAASIVAKVTRDRMMKEAAKEFPFYGFDGHKGYGSEDHIRAIKEHGPCALHRMTYLRNILAHPVSMLA